MSILAEISHRFPVRKGSTGTADFEQWAEEYMVSLGYTVQRENARHCATSLLIAGDPETASVVIGAKYGTPARSLLPEWRVPRNGAVYALMTTMKIFGLMAAAVAAGCVMLLLFRTQAAFSLTFAGVFCLLLWVKLNGPANPHNVNGGDASIAALLETMAGLPPEKRGQCAFLLYRDTASLRAYAQDHPQLRYTRLLMNLEAVGVGETFLWSVPRLAVNQPAYQALEKAAASVEKRKTVFFPAWKVHGRGDERLFQCGVGIGAYGWKLGIGYWVGRLCTPRDTQADEVNVQTLAQILIEGVPTPAQDTEKQ